MAESPSEHDWCHRVPDYGQLPWAREIAQPENVVWFSAPPAACQPATHVSVNPFNPLPEKIPNPLFIPNAQIKRSNSADSDDDDEDSDVHPPPSKICATADKVIARLRSLHINGRVTPPNSSSSDVFEEVEIEEEQQDKSPVVHFSNEMKSVMAAAETADPMRDIALQEAEKSSKAVILWTPNPCAPIIPIVETVDSDDSEEAADESLSDVNSDGVLIEELISDDEAEDVEMIE